MTARAHLWHFHGGLRLPGHKAESTALPIAPLALPAQLVLPLVQHIGAPAEPLVTIGERVLKGQPIARAGNNISAPVHASSSGTVSAIEPRAIPHPSGLSVPCIVIATDGLDESATPSPGSSDPCRLPADEIRNRVRDAGIVGLGGAGFPTHVKLNPGAKHLIETLIINGAECEPYISCDDMLMREHAREVVEGARIMRHAVHAAHCIIGIEDNKPAARTALQHALKELGETDMRVVTVPTRYPTGGEKQLIKVLTGREVPSQGRPLDIGLLCHNVGTAVAVYRAVVLGQPLISRIVTVTGAGVAQPRNFDVPLGAPVSALITAAGGYTLPQPQLLMGGPMMGLPLRDDSLPVIKTTNCILAMPAPAAETELPCIRCGKCVSVCPANLLPQELYWQARARDFDKAQDQHLFDCIECGCCDAVCPSHIPLVRYYRYAKTEIWTGEKERRKADLARQRHEARLARQERDKAERAARLQKHKTELHSSEETDVDPKKAAVQAALERVKAKQQIAEDT
jgi:Na+-translocating ferredoxin:NAD+ oxidoreductase subunit C